MSQFSDFLNTLPTRLVKKGEVLLKNGEKSDEAYYVISGCLRSYILDQKGKEHIYQFAPEGWIISDLEHHKNRGNALLNIDTIEDSKIIAVKISLFQNNSDGDKKMMNEAINKLNNRVYALQKRIIQLLSYSAEERYKDFMTTYPNLYSRIPLKMVASYLGVTPESLSRVRKEMAKQ